MTFQTPLFTNLRIQMIYPCMASCRWCGTWKKNPQFMQMYNKGIADKIHSFYLEMIEKVQPEFLFLSGGEPILLPNIVNFLIEAAPYVRNSIHLFTSFQYPLGILDNIQLNELPFEKIKLTHTTAGFNEYEWKKITNFPFNDYIKNIKVLSRYPWQKHFKFILNHDNLEEELNNFRNLIKPDDSFKMSLKLLNNQAGNYAVGEIKKTKDDTKKKLERADTLLGNLKLEKGITGKEVIKDFAEGKDGSNCKYRKNPVELRFAYFRYNEKHFKLKYRFCSHFPSSKAFIYRSDKHNIDSILKNYNKGKWHSWCKNCRLKLYVREK